MEYLDDTEVVEDVETLKDKSDAWLRSRVWVCVVCIDEALEEGKSMGNTLEYWQQQQRELVEELAERDLLRLKGE